MRLGPQGPDTWGDESFHVAGSIAAGVESTVAAAVRKRTSAGGGSELDRYFRAFGHSGRSAAGDAPTGKEGYFSYEGITCFGRGSATVPVADSVEALPAIETHSGTLRFPFDVDTVVRNLREERYRQPPSGALDRYVGSEIVRSTYYALRPVLPVGLRKHLQRARLSGWRHIRFPAWPVDDSVDRLMGRALVLEMRRRGVTELPFVWFWPDGASSALMMTHDLETRDGERRCDELMDLDDGAGLKAAFQIVPEMHGKRQVGLVHRLRSRGFEVNIHDYRHDGELFRSRDRFVARVEEVNRLAREMGCRGFRSGSMYREQRWLPELDIDYDMSVPNVAHLEPQRGGCCTVMPYFVGDVLELPLTTTQDYSLFHILGDYSIDLWRTQAEMIGARHGLISFIVHPDYLDERRARRVFVKLLAYIRELRSSVGLWVALPGEVDRWWRNRQEMSLVRHAGGWSVQGPDSARARVAFAKLEGERLSLHLTRSTAVRSPESAIA